MQRRHSEARRRSRRSQTQTATKMRVSFVSRLSAFVALVCVCVCVVASSEHAKLSSGRENEATPTTSPKRKSASHSGAQATGGPELADLLGGAPGAVLAPLAPLAEQFKSELVTQLTEEQPKGLWQLVDKVFALLLGTDAPDEKGTKSKYAEFALNDHSNDHLVYATPQELIESAGFKHQTHLVQADDGYITQVLQVINPLADRRKLKQPPVAMFHGGTLDTAQYIIQSTVQHRPERWPRVEGAIHTSWNRSLAFVLANNGYDVWLVGSRGCNSANQGHRRLTNYKRLMGTDPVEQRNADWSGELMQTALNYWSNHTFDDMIEKEMPRQLERIMQLTNSPKVSIVALSNSSPSTMGLLASRPDIGARVHNYVIIAPVLSDKNTHRMGKLFYRTFGTMLDDKIGAILWSEMLLSRPFRDAVLALIKAPLLRYSLIKLVTNVAFGPSPRFQTLIEPNSLNHIMNPLGYKTLKHICQTLIAGKVQRFDYGPIENKLRYNSLTPPEYDMSKMKCANWMIVTAEHDPLCNKEDVDKLIATTPKRPYKHVYLKNANHLDTVLMFENDIKINLPILKFMDKFPYKRPKRSTHCNCTRVDLKKVDKILAKFVPPYDRTLHDKSP